MAAPSASGRPVRPLLSRASRLAAGLLLAPALLLFVSACAGQGEAAGGAPTEAALDPADTERLARPAPESLDTPDTPGATTTPEPLIAAEPDEHSEVGSLVAGFPVELLPIPGDAVILVTSVMPVGDADVQEISLNLTTALPTEELATLYRGALTAAGFEEVEAQVPSADLAVEATFTRSGGDELISIGILDVDGVRTVALGGRVHTGD